MAVLTAADREVEWAQLMRVLSARSESVDISKSELRAAFDAADDWVEANQASFNTALPVAARTSLTATQKAELLLYVVRRRWEVG